MSKADAQRDMYQGIVGDAWRKLNPAVFKAHLNGGDSLAAKAVFRVEHSRNPLARLMAWLARLPAEADAAPVTLAVRRVPNGETWSRTFGTTKLLSTQVDVGDGLLTEKFGLTELRFRLSVSDGSLIY